MSDSTVSSPAGIRLAVGLVAPFLTPAGRAEVRKAWHQDAEDLHAEAIEAALVMGRSQVLHAALAVWTRLPVPPEAVDRLGNLLKELPTSDQEAQRALDAWTSEHTLGMIADAPVRVGPATTAVVASALALDAQWETPGTPDPAVRFDGRSVAGFTRRVRAGDTGLSPDGRTAVSRHRLRVPEGGEDPGLLVSFAMDERGPEAGLEALLLDSTLAPLQAGHPLVATVAGDDPGRVEVTLPRFAFARTTDLLREADRWGLAHASDPREGMPGLGEGSYVGQARQAALIEVTHEGVRAAAAAFMGVVRAAFSPGGRAEALALHYDRPFAFAITHPQVGVLFQGTYAGG